jgi:hypothetical protein
MDLFGLPSAAQARQKMLSRKFYRAGEYLAAIELTLNGADVSFASEGLPYDLIAEIGSQFLKVQVKTASSPSYRGQYVFASGVMYAHGHKRRYRPEEVDLFAFVAMDMRRCIFIAGTEIKLGLRLRPESFRVPDVAQLSLSRFLRKSR